MPLQAISTRCCQGLCAYGLRKSLSKTGFSEGTTKN
jgi:hypothetical protein